MGEVSWKEGEARGLGEGLEQPLCERSVRGGGGGIVETEGRVFQKQGGARCPLGLSSCVTPATKRVLSHHL